VVTLLGSGGMGEVYRARDPRLRREVAVKLIPRHFAADPERLRRFEQESLAAAGLNHRHIVAVYDVGVDDGSPYMVTELVEGESLRQRLSAGALPVETAIQFGLQLTEGVAAAHERGIAHRDLKPDNVIVSRDDQLKIVDFGLAKLFELEVKAPGPDGTTLARLTEPGMVMGTPGYMAPEQARGEPADHRADIFAIGGVLYEMLSGRPPFQRQTTPETLTAVLREDPPDLRTLNRRVSPALARLVARCLKKQPSQRFQSARDLAFALETIAELGEPTAESGNDAAPARRWPAWRYVALAVVAAALVLGGFMLRGSITPSEPDPKEVRTYRVTDARGVEDHPSISPDGRSVAYVADVGGRKQVFVRLVDRGTSLQLTSDAADHLHPRWSPDSTLVLYYRAPDEGESAGSIWEVSALGGGARRIARSIGGADVSHDGKRLVFPRLDDGRRQLVAVSAKDGSGIEVLAELEPTYHYLNVRWSFDDRFVAYVRGLNNSWEIFVVSVVQRQSHPIISEGHRLDGLTWAPEGTGIIFGSPRGSTSWYLPATNLWRIDFDWERLETAEQDVHAVDGTSLRQLTFGESSYMNPDTNSSGALVMARFLRQYDLWQIPTDQSPADNVRNALRLTHQTSAVHAPSAAPNGREIVYVSDSGNHANLWVMDLDTLQSRQITYETAPDLRVGLPLWSPDGNHIAYWSSGSSRNDADGSQTTDRPAGMYVVRPDGSESRLLARNGQWAAWSPDGQWLYFSDFPLGTHLRKVRVAGGSPELVRDDNPTRVAIAADGALYYAVDGPIVSGGPDLEVRVARPESAESRVLARIPWERSASASPGGSFQPVLSPDGQWLAWALQDGIRSETTNLSLMSTSTGELRQFTDFGGQPTTIIRRVSWSADGRSIFAAVGRYDSDVVWIDGLL
jgi:serine/threonine protein kinase